MKSKFVVSLTVLFSVGLGHFPANASLITFSFNNALGNEPSFAPDSPPVNLTATDMSRGTGLAATPNAGTFSASGWTTGSTLDPNDYFTFSLTPDSGYSLALTQLILDERRSLTGIRKWSVRSSLDSFASDLGLFTIPDNDLIRADETTTLSGALFGNITGTVQFRIYGYSSESASGTWRIDNVRLEGVVNPVAAAALTPTAVPETLPLSFVSLTLLGTVVAGRSQLRTTFFS